jgi:predicted unusual protein kinase regulating ubiquinone biosynthesis (AarF/ABC1/UbiB family)
MRDNVRVNDVPKNPVTRAAKMARLPLGLAGRTALGVGKRIGGRSAEVVAQEIQQRTADQIFRVLGELKGGAMKLGQALSIFEAALPPELAGPYRATLTKLQESAPPLPARSVHQVLAATWARTGGTTSPSSATPRPPPRPSARCTRRPGGTAGRSR